MDWSTIVVSGVTALLASAAGAFVGGKISERAAIKGAERAAEIEFCNERAKRIREFAFKFNGNCMTINCVLLQAQKNSKSSIGELMTPIDKFYPELKEMIFEFKELFDEKELSFIFKTINISQILSANYNTMDGNKLIAFIEDYNDERDFNLSKEIHDASEYKEGGVAFSIMNKIGIHIGELNHKIGIKM